MKQGELALSPGGTRAVSLLRALANPARFRIVELLAERKDCTSAQLADELPLAQSSLFDHLAALRESGIVGTSGEGPHRYYAIEPDVLDFLAAYLSGLGQRTRSWSGLVAAREEGGMRIREATAADAAAIATIYNQGIADRMATLETEPRSAEERAAWLATHTGRYPVLVATDADGTVAGWGSLNQFNPRPAYDHVVDFSLYVARERRGQGIGDALLGALEERARGFGFHKMVLAGFPTNKPGLRLYERHGFTLVGIYHEQGLLDGCWVDTMVMEKLLG